MDCILAIPEFIWNSISGSLGSLIQGIMEEPFGAVTSMILLKSREQDLRREMRALMGKHADLLGEIRRGRPENEDTNEAKIWLDQVEEVRSAAEKFQIDFQRREGFSSYQLGCNVNRVLKDARRLMTERNDLTVLVPAPPDPVVHWPQFSRVVGVEHIRSKICGLVEDEGSRIIGVHGMGGVGKTTLLREINNYFFDKCSRRFDPVIIVEVSNNVDIDGIQKNILSQLAYSDRDEKRRLPESRNERKMTLCRELCHRNFLLLLDDLWKKLDLAEVGISDANNGSKIVFTTRSKAVCIHMEADQKLRVPYLNRESSWELFRLHVGENIDELDPATTNLAQQVAEKCGGLPLALVTLGKAMAGALTDYEWEAALKTIKGTAAEVEEIEQVRTILKFSYDRLKDGHKKCLLYCSIFPEDWVINVDELTKLWVGEGFLETSDCSFGTACTRSRMAITALKTACLLEDSRESERSKESVKLHDMVREMALWILGLEKTTFVVDPSETLTRAKMMEKWTHATTISLMSNKISELPEWPQWQNLQTLLLSGCSNLKQIPSGFFESMSLLSVLDLCGTKIESLPAEIGSVNNLRYLNLAGTLLKLLPKELGKLTNLRILNLDALYTLERIPKDAISSLSSLQSLTMNYGSYKWKGGWKDDGGEYVGREVYLKDLDGLSQLEELQLKVRVEFDEDLQGLSHCHKLCSVIRTLLVMETLGSFSSSRNQLILPVDQLTKLEKLQLEDISAESIFLLYGDEFMRKGIKCARFQNLQSLKLLRCKALRGITWIGTLPCLKYLSLQECGKLVEIATVEESKMTNADPQKDSFFPSLTEINLEGMQNLKCISKRPLLFPRLKKFQVKDCLELETLSFELNNAPCLESLSLCKCNKLVEIITVKESKMTNADPQKDSFFPSLTKINLEGMQNLKCICKRPLLFPRLKKFRVKDCLELETLSFELNNAPCLEYLSLCKCNKLVEIITVKESNMTNANPQKDSFFPSLTEINLEGMQNLKCISKRPLLFPRLKKFQVKDCLELETLSFELNNAPCLEVLSLQECGKLVEIATVEESKMTNANPQKNSFFPSLTEINLEGMQNLKCISKRPLLFPRLKKFQVKDCLELETLSFELNSGPCLEVLSLDKCNKLAQIITVEESKMADADPQKDSFFPSLTTIHLEGMQSLKCICKRPLLFPRLKKFRVKDCPELETLSFELNSGPCLKYLSLRWCKKLVEIITVKESKMTNANPQKDSFFPSLKTINLEGMQNLKCICKRPLSFPRLNYVWVRDCPELEKLPFDPNKVYISIS